MLNNNAKIKTKETNIYHLLIGYMSYYIFIVFTEFGSHTPIDCPIIIFMYILNTGDKHGVKVDITKLSCKPIKIIIYYLKTY